MQTRLAVHVCVATSVFVCVQLWLFNAASLSTPIDEWDTNTQERRHKNSDGVSNMPNKPAYTGTADNTSDGSNVKKPIRKIRPRPFLNNAAKPTEEEVVDGVTYALSHSSDSANTTLMTSTSHADFSTAPAGSHLTTLSTHTSETEVLELFDSSSNASLRLRLSAFKPNSRRGFNRVCYFDVCEGASRYHFPNGHLLWQHGAGAGNCTVKNKNSGLCVDAFKVLSDAVSVHFAEGCVEKHAIPASSRLALWSQKSYSPADGRVEIPVSAGYFVLASLTDNCTLPKNATCIARDPDAVSALARARSPQCRELIQNVTCRFQAGTLYPQLDHNRPQDCPVDPIDLQLPPSQSDPVVRIAFMIVCHGRSLRQILRLLKVIYSPNHSYLIHVDSRSSYLYEELQSFVSPYPNIELTEWRMATIWGGSNLYEMYLRGMRDLAKLKWDYFINLSGADYPIHRIDELEKMLSGYKNTRANFLKSHPHRSDQRFVKKQGLNRTFVLCDDHMYRVGSRILPQDLKIDGGSDWFMLHKSFCMHLISSDSFVRQLRAWYDFTLLGAESFFHIAASNGPFCNSFIGRNHRLANWNRKRGCKCQYKAIVDWCGCSPNVFVPSDVQKLKIAAAQNTFFGRKFDARISMSVIATVEDEMLKVNTGLTKEYYWESVFKNGEDETSSTALLMYARSWVRLASHQEFCGLSSYGDSLQIQEIFTIFFRDILLGYSVVLGSGSSVWEILVKPVANGSTIHFTPGNPQGFQALSVGTGYDKKERLFNRWGGLLTVADNWTAQALWNPASRENFQVIWENPAGFQITQNESIQQFAEVWYSDFATSSNARIAGRWRLSLKPENGKEFAAVSFPLLDQASMTDDEIDRTVSHFWNFHSLCSVNVECPKFDAMNCKSSPWSSFRSDGVVRSLVKMSDS